MSPSTPTERPSIRRIVTGHTPDGKAIFADDSPVQSYPFKGSTTLFTDLFWQEGFPAKSDGGLSEEVKTHDGEIVNGKGTLLRAVDMPPRTESVGGRLSSHKMATYGDTALHRYSTVQSRLTTASSFTGL